MNKETGRWFLTFEGIDNITLEDREHIAEQIINRCNGGEIIHGESNIYSTEESDEVRRDRYLKAKNLYL